MEPAALETKSVRIDRSPIHGLGGFAKTAIPKGARVIEYLGIKISKQESLRRCEADSEYIFAINDEWDLDGNVEGNPARFLNHSCSPNCEVVLENERLWIVASRDIPPGEEITFNYGYDLESYQEHPCRCGSPNCIGYIVAVELFDHVAKNRRLTC